MLKTFIARHSIPTLIIISTCAVATSARASEGYVYEAVGEVTIGTGKNATHTVVKNDVIPSDTVVNTGHKSYALLKFEDGQVAIMQANTAFHVREYRYNPTNPAKSNIVFSKFTGGMRFITGLIGQRNHKAFRLATPNATIGIRGTEFMVVTVNNTLYSRVISGSISMTNEAGMVVFNAGQNILVASPNTLPIAVPATALPPGIFNQLDAIPVPAALSAPLAESGAAETPHVAALAATTDAAIPPTAVALPAISTTGFPASLSAARLSSPLLPAAVSNGMSTSPGTTTLSSAPVPIVSATPPLIPSAKTISITGSGATYAGANDPCDFCTGRNNTVATHTVPKKDTAEGNPVTGDANMFGKHNLTSTGANTGEICAFCHTPQGSESSAVSAPLWNRTAAPLSSYRAYSSLGSAAAEATGSVSLSCLSCHDGSQAPNIVINTPNNNLNIPEGEQINIGNDLKNHHPVGMPYAGGGQNQNAPEVPADPGAAYTRLEGFNRYASIGNKFTFLNRRGVYNLGDIAAKNDVRPFSNAGLFKREDFNKSIYSGTGNSTVWWIETPNSKKGRQKSDLYLFTRTDTIDSIPSESTLQQPYVECATCHDPHSTNPIFLRLPGGNARSQVCLTCHNK